MTRILITGASGFIGSALCIRLSSDYKVVGVDIANGSLNNEKINWEQADLTDLNSVAAMCEKHSPDVVIHCAGIAHQKMGAVGFDAYMRVNSEATENLARIAAKWNPDVRFIFLSSVSVYGEDNLSVPVSEDSKCKPSSDYAASKLDAERRLIALSDGGTTHNLIILRLAPVYDRNRSFNLNRRVLAPMNTAYIRFGSGSQKMSALARPNLVDFIEFLIHRLTQIPDKLTQQNKLNTRRIAVLNVCDEKAYKFNEIIQVFKKSGIRPNRPVISIPLIVVWLTTRMAGIFFAKNKKWFHSCYEKLASTLVFNNEKMLNTGFKPRHSLETLFDPQITQTTQEK